MDELEVEKGQLDTAEKAALAQYEKARQAHAEKVRALQAEAEKAREVRLAQELEEKAKLTTEAKDVPASIDGGPSRFFFFCYAGYAVAAGGHIVANAHVHVLIFAFMQ